MDYKKKNNFYRNLLAAPFIWVVLGPLVLLDFFMELYHRICFPLYGLTIIKRSKYIKLDHQQLSYLKWWEKLGCIYCSYANGLLLYDAAIAAETQRYWCGIKHQKDAEFTEPSYQKDFMEFGDKKSYNELEENYRQLWSKGSCQAKDNDHPMKNEDDEVNK